MTKSEGRGERVSAERVVVIIDNDGGCNENGRG